MSTSMQASTSSERLSLVALRARMLTLRVEVISEARGSAPHPLWQPWREPATSAKTTPSAGVVSMAQGAEVSTTGHVPRRVHAGCATRGNIRSSSTSEVAHSKAADGLVSTSAVAHRKAAVERVPVETEIQDGESKEALGHRIPAHGLLDVGRLRVHRAHDPGGDVGSCLRGPAASVQQGIDVVSERRVPLLVEGEAAAEHLR